MTRHTRFIRQNAGDMLARMIPVRKDLRLGNWDYSRNSCYHVVFCTDGRKTLLSRVARTESGECRIVLSPIGRCVRTAIEQAAAQYEAVSVDIHAIMPNHVHLIVSILGEEDARTTLGRFVSFAKSGATRAVRAEHPELKLWQRGYYDHILRDDEDYFRVWEYIENNPANWADDNYFVE